MSAQNEETIRRLLDAFNRRDKSSWVELCDPELEWFPPAEWPENAAASGAEGAWDLLTALDDPWQEGPYELGEVTTRGDDRLAARITRRVRGRTSGVDVDFAYWNVATFRDGKLARSEWFLDRDQAFARLG